MKIAIVDDEPALRKLTAHNLTDYCNWNNFSVEIAEFGSGEEFLKDFEPQDFDLIFMDVYMPGLDGIETVQKIRKKDFNVFVIFLTASEGHMRYAFNCHAFDYMVKPVHREDFFRVMDEFVRALGHEAVEDEKFVEFVANRMNIKLSDSQLVSVSVQGHSLYVCDDKRNIYTSKMGFSAFTELVEGWDNILIINRSVLVNMDFVDSFEGTEVTMKDGWTFFAKVRSAKELKQVWTDWKLSR